METKRPRKISTAQDVRPRKISTAHDVRPRRMESREKKQIAGRKVESRKSRHTMQGHEWAQQT